ncbi:unnamed protein product [Orchesella dallaii]|uniref:Uncharacterized protein n=1 Tax=Orchesella dallaii TaxID=48710 RepID=A0ABP1QSP5_9HEXA
MVVRGYLLLRWRREQRKKKRSCSIIQEEEFNPQRHHHIPPHPFTSAETRRMSKLFHGRCEL